MSERTFVLLESPLSGDVDCNKAYALRAMKDSINRGEAPFASHLLYTQVLDDTIDDERNLGIEIGLAVGKFTDRTVVYQDLGISSGMQYGIERATREGRKVEYRNIGAN